MLRYGKHLKDKARDLRKNMTLSEWALWSRLKGKQVLGVQFYRQKPIGEFIVDFYAPKAHIVIEVDGSQHLQGEHSVGDRKRDQFLAGQGLKVLRFNSSEVLTHTDEVAEVIYRAVGAAVKG